MKVCRQCSNQFEGKQCMVCHKAYRVKNAEIIKIKSKAFREANKERLAAEAKVKREQNKDKIRLYKAKYAAANSAKIVAKVAAWRVANPNRKREQSHNYRARKRAGGKISMGLAERLYALQKGKCACCGKKLGKDYQMDHIMPLALGGDNADSNMQLLTTKCNLQKNAKHPVTFMQQRGFLL